MVGSRRAETYQNRISLRVRLGGGVYFWTDSLRSTSHLDGRIKLRGPNTPLGQRPGEYVVQRKMLRKMIGWIHVDTDDWETIRHVRKMRQNQCLAKYPIEDWSCTLKSRKLSLVLKSDSWPLLVQLSTAWDPRECHYDAHRKVGQPPLRWNDDLSN